VVSLLGGLGLWTALATATWADAAGPASVGPVLERQGFPWYDGRTGRAVPVLPWPDLGAGRFKTLEDWLERIGRWFSSMNGRRVPGVGGLGDLIAVGLALLLLTVVLVVLLEMLRRYRPVGDDPGAGKASAVRGLAGRVEGLPGGDALDLTDPWARAVRLRDEGDYAAAVIYLFAHQVLTLDRLRLVRLAPGRTARQLVSSVADRRLRAAVEPTLRMFESVYYGHRTPGREAFEAVWASALAFEAATAEGAPA
jgi:hypothetical protein